MNEPRPAHSSFEGPIEDHMATARFPSMPEAPPRPARPPSMRPPAVTLSRPAWWEEKPKWWWMFLPFMFQATVRPTTVADEARHDVRLRRRVGFLCGGLGVALIVGALALGFSSLAGERFPERADQLALAVSIVIARAAMSIVGVFAGYEMLSLAERLAVPTFEARPDKRVSVVTRPMKDAPRASRPSVDAPDSMRVLS